MDDIQNKKKTKRGRSGVHNRHENTCETVENDIQWWWLSWICLTQLRFLGESHGRYFLGEVLPSPTLVISGGVRLFNETWFFNLQSWRSVESVGKLRVRSVAALKVTTGSWNTDLSFRNLLATNAELPVYPAHHDTSNHNRPTTLSNHGKLNFGSGQLIGIIWAPEINRQAWLLLGVS